MRRANLQRHRGQRRTATLYLILILLINIHFSSCQRRANYKPRSNQRRQQNGEQQQQQNGGAFYRQGEYKRQHHEEHQKQGHNVDEEDIPWNEIMKDETTSVALKVIFPNPKPRGLLHAAYKASKSAALGVLLGMASFVTFPATAAVLGGAALGPIIRSTLLGTVLGLVSVGFGTWNALVQFYWGIRQVPRSFQSWWTDMVWNPKDGSWSEYNLDAHAEKLQQALISEEGDKSYYQVLEVPLSASKSQIKKAYRQKALLFHPDKTTDEEDLERFLLLQKAYQTLADETKRSLYDQWGEAPGDGYPFDPYVFIAVFFKAFPLEDYIGELAISVWAEQAFHLASSITRPQPSQTECIEKLIKMVANTESIGENREVQVALKLRQTFEPYISGSMEEVEFRKWCQEEALKLLGSGATPGLLGAFGSSLYSSARQFRGFHSLAPFSWPLGVLTWTQKAISGTATRFQVYKGIFDVFQELLALFSEHHGGPLQDDMPMILNDKMHEMIPQIMELTESFNVWDVTKTAEATCWKLFRDSEGSRSQQFARARAAMILGEEFVVASLDWPVDEANVMKRFEDAVFVAKTKVCNLLSCICSLNLQVDILHGAIAIFSQKVLIFQDTRAKMWNRVLTGLTDLSVATVLMIMRFLGFLGLSRNLLYRSLSRKNPRIQE